MNHAQRDEHDDTHNAFHSKGFVVFTLFDGIVGQFRQTVVSVDVPFNGKYHGRHGADQAVEPVENSVPSHNSDIVLKISLSLNELLLAAPCSISNVTV